MSDLEQKILKSHSPEAFLEEKFHSLGFEQLTDIQKRSLQIIHQKRDTSFWSKLKTAPEIKGRDSEFICQKYMENRRSEI